MRALLDVSLFGFVHQSRNAPGTRTGVFRVVEQSAVVLTARTDVDVKLCAAEDHDATHTFVEAHPVLRTLPFASDVRNRATDVLRRRIVDLELRGASSRAVLPLRALRRAVRPAGAVDPISRLSPTTLDGADVYHVPFGRLPDLPRTMPGLRKFLTVHDVTPIVRPELVWKDAAAWTRRMIDTVGPDDWVLAISQHTKDDLLGVRPELDPARVFVTHLAADRARFYPCGDAERVAAARARYGVPEGPYVLSVGSLVPHKNLVHLVRTFADLVRSERVDDLHLVLTGPEAWDFAPLAAALADLGALRERVVFTGYVDDADLAPLYSGALAFVFPSLYEGFGLPPLEAMQCGAPVITSDTSSLPEVVGDAGVLVEPHDRAALAQAILDVYRDPARRAQLAARSLARAAQFSWDRYASETVAAYRAAA